MKAEGSGLAWSLRKLCQNCSGGTGRVRARHRIAWWLPPNQALATAPQTGRDQLGHWCARDELCVAIQRGWLRMHIRGAGRLVRWRGVPVFSAWNAGPGCAPGRARPPAVPVTAGAGRPPPGAGPDSLPPDAASYRPRLRRSPAGA